MIREECSKRLAVKNLPVIGTWVPLPVASCITGYTYHALRYMWIRKEIIGIFFEKGPMLVNIEEIANKADRI